MKTLALLAKAVREVYGQVSDVCVAYTGRGWHVSIQYRQDATAQTIAQEIHADPAWATWALATEWLRRVRHFGPSVTELREHLKEGKGL